MAKTCLNCSYAYNPDDAEQCLMCKASLIPTLIMVELGNSNNVCPVNNVSFDNNHQAQFASADVRSATVHESTPLPDENDQRGDERVLDGRVSYIERHDERPPTDYYGVISRILIGILIFIPFSIWFVLFGLITFVFAIIGFRGVSHMFNPLIWSTALFEFLELLVLRRIRGTDTAPIYRGMVEDNDRQEYAFYFRGPLQSGNIVAGHHVRLNGRWVRGAFQVQNGMDLTTQSDILSRYRNPWRWVFFILLILYSVMGIVIYRFLPSLGGHIG